MAKEVLMPKLSSTMETGYVTQWIKHEGDKVRVGDPIFEEIGRASCRERV